MTPSINTMSLVVGQPFIEDFYEANPVLAKKKEFALTKENYPEEASNICWAVFLLEDPDKKVNKLANMPREDKLAEIREQYYNLDTDAHKDLIVAYAKLALPKEEFFYKIQIDKMEELTTRMRKLNLESDTDLDTYLKIMDKLPRMWAAMDKVKQTMLESEAKGNIRGGAVASRRETR